MAAEAAKIMAENGEGRCGGGVAGVPGGENVGVIWRLVIGGYFAGGIWLAAKLKAMKAHVKISSKLVWRSTIENRKLA
jgi:hypothetical protein